MGRRFPLSEMTSFKRLWRGDAFIALPANSRFLATRIAVAILFASE
jgi:hypothetical protein